MAKNIETRIRKIKRKVELRGIQLGPPASESDLLLFERASNIILPEGFRHFLLDIGNGGDGPPAYGLNAFVDGKIDCGIPWEKIVADVSKPFPFTEYWTWDDREQDDERCAQTFHGNIRVGTDGCDMHWLLIVTGPERGKIWDWLDFSVQPCPDRRDFLSWYEDWLNGRDDRSIPPKKAVSDEAFYEMYPAAAAQEEKNTHERRKWWMF